jgi:hypothetical protein
MTPNSISPSHPSTIRFAFAVGVTNNLDCECDFFVNLERGFGADVECFYENEFCFVGERTFEKSSGKFLAHCVEEMKRLTLSLSIIVR